MQQPTAPIFYVTRLRPPVYRTEVLAQLNQQLDGRLVVAAGAPPEGSSFGSIISDGGPYTTLSLPTYWRGDQLHAHFWPKVFARYGRPAAVLAEEAVRSATWPALVYYCKLRRIPLVSWGHFSSNDRAFDPETHRADRFRLHMARRATACVGYTEGVIHPLRPYIAADRLFVAPNTLDVARLAALRTSLMHEGQRALRQRLGLRHVPTLVFMGRLIPEKGTAMLLDVYRLLRREQDLQLVVIGEGEARASMQARLTPDEEGDVHFTGGLTTYEASAPYLAAADVMVVPGYLGLVVNHAFAFGLPVVSQASPGTMRYHSPEIEYVRPGENGLLTPHGDAAAMARGIEAILSDLSAYSAAAYAYATTHLALDRMVDGLHDALRYAQKTS
ncbi:MAG: glycosyltransferase family 4 protein [Bacteroidota bacterium]